MYFGLPETRSESLLVRIALHKQLESAGIDAGEKQFDQVHFGELSRSQPAADQPSIFRIRALLGS